MYLSKILYKGGTNFPGKIALKFDKNILKKVAHNYTVILITGTNGKTTTTNMIYTTIKNNGEFVITNDTGANLFTGIITCFIKNYIFFDKRNNKYAVIEVDEANVKYITQHINPKIITITNIFRDQLDRYGEVYSTLNKILEGIKGVPDSTLILNGDESLFGNLNLPNKTLYYGFSTPIVENKELPINADAKFCKFCKHEYKYNFITYNHLGDFYCENCGYKRPSLNYYVDKIISLSSIGSVFNINNKEYLINQFGTYNIYNALCAFSVSKTLGIKDSVIQYSFRSLHSSFGRQEVVKIKDKNIKIILVKNPAGFDEALNSISLDKRDISLALLLNDNYADGKDISWIWDVDFENLKNPKINDILVSGIRMYDMGIRLKVAGFEQKIFSICDNYDSLLTNIQTCNNSTIYLLATYTAMTGFRKFLNNKGYIRKLW
ncbi:MurT ligase domain-containing protein [Clostridium aestuarii]|uniref:Lipid II isoglutaminyl synthase (glutamine-hydrolyzing) subunit MurT n=1 Tax=Clostridium aestuarii TaxID=338193 RepID=A0ABT4CZY9_9CLOT|nr:MurT ligase domain-containing protein [Clostridium aestuarii]MCY6484551.1 MurT ligase domain-containing protein [Clostridium aestuarii]